MKQKQQCSTNALLFTHLFNGNPPYTPQVIYHRTELVIWGKNHVSRKTLVERRWTWEVNSCRSIVIKQSVWNNREGGKIISSHR